MQMALQPTQQKIFFPSREFSSNPEILTFQTPKVSGFLILNFTYLFTASFIINK